MKYKCCIGVQGRAGREGPSQAEIDADLAERMSAMRRPDESDMDYFERRYQERVGWLWFNYKF